jgi:aspartyl-tRNA(Asn)/glutamyl-tRNA(Gln) amidotransferase subunit C
MASAEEVKKLAALARVKVADEDLPRFVKEFEAILAYVGQLEQLSIDVKGKKAPPALRNVMREDGEPHEKGIYTEALTTQFPEREGDYLKVKQIISYD